MMKKFLFFAAIILGFNNLVEAQSISEDGVLTIAEGTTAIANKAYYGNTEIKKVVIPSSVTKIGQLAFHNCINLEEVDIPASVTTIGNAAFQNDSSLTKVTLHEGLTDLSYRLFKNTAISEIVIPSSVKSIGNEVFAGCWNLTEIRVDKYSDAHALLSADSRLVFTDNEPVRTREEWLASVTSDILEDGVLTIAAGATEITGSKYAGNNSIVKVVCPPSLKRINAYAFRNCKNLEEVYLADTKILMGYVFNGCSSLKKIVVSDSLSQIGNMCIPDATELDYPEGSWAQNWYETKYFLTVNDTAIAANKYKGAVYKKVTIGDNVKSIGNNAFANLSNLQELNMGSNVERIGSNAFSGCKKITSVVLPSTLQSLEASAFSGCSLLANINLPSQLESIGESCFANTALKSADIPNTVKTVGASAFKGSLVESVTFGTGVADITETVCSQCPNLKSVVIKGAERITSNAFNGSPMLESVTLNEGLTFIGCYAFKDCAALSSIELPLTLKTIMAQAFIGTGISQCDLPEGLTNVSANSFPEGVLAGDITDKIELKPLNLGITFPTYPLAEDKYVVKSMKSRVINLERITTITADKGDLDWAYERINFPEWNRDYQCILDILGGGADNYELITNSTGERYIRASVGRIPKGESRTIVVRFKVLRTPTEYNGYLSDTPVDHFDDFVAHYLKPSSELGGIVSDSPIFQAIAEENKAVTNSPAELAKLAYLYPWDHIRFEKPGTTLGPLKALELGYGDCTEFASLFISICRASGIPSRHIAVATYGGNEPLEFNGHNHSVAEIYLEPVGWFAVDANLGGGSLGGRHRFGHVTTIQLYMRPEGVNFESYAPAVSPSNLHKYETTWRATEADCGELQAITITNVRKADAKLAENHPVEGVPAVTFYTDEEAMQNIINSNNAPSASAYETSLLPPAPDSTSMMVDKWGNGDFETSFAERTWDFSDTIPSIIKKTGVYSIVFTYKSGVHKLVLKDAVVKVNGDMLLSVPEERSATLNSKTIKYTFQLDTIPSSLILTAQAMTSGGTNSIGLIEIKAESDSTVIDTISNPGGETKPLQTLAVGSWKKDEFTTSFTPRTWDFSDTLPAIVQKPGIYSIVFTYKSGGQRLVLKDAVVRSDGDTLIAVPDERSAGSDPKAIKYTFKIDSVPSSLILTAYAMTSGGTNSNGVIEIRAEQEGTPTDSISELDGTLAHKMSIESWKKGDYTTSYTDRFWDFSSLVPTVVKAPGPYSILFTYKAGAHKLVLSEAAIKADGLVVDSFPEEMSAGSKPKTIIYSFTLNSIPKKLILTAKGRTDGGNNSNGVIEFLSGNANDVVIDSVLWIGVGKTSIASNAYAGREDFNKVVIPEGVTMISSYAFRNNPNLVEVVLPTTCTTLMGFVFQNCSRLTTIDLSHVTSFGDYVFNGCNALEDAHLSDDVTKMGWLTFPESTVIYCKAGGIVYDFVRKNGSEYFLTGYTDEWQAMLAVDPDLISEVRRSYFTFDKMGHQCECYTNRPMVEPTVQEHITRLVINCHGAPPGPAFFCKQAFKHLGKQCDNARVIAPALFNKPYFPADSPDNAIWFDNAQYLGGVGAYTAKGEYVNISAYEIIDEMVRNTLTSGYYPNIKEVWIEGLSAGGTTIAHYSIVNVVQNEFPDIKFKYVAKCIPDYVYLSDEREVEISESRLLTYDNYPNGLSNLEDTTYYPGKKGLTAEQIVEQFRTRRALFITGSMDDKIVDDPFAHGDNWVARNENYRIHLNKVYGMENRTQFTYIVKGRGHVDLGDTHVVQDFLWTDTIPQALIDEMNYQAPIFDTGYVVANIVFPAEVTPTDEQLVIRHKQDSNYILAPGGTYKMGDTRGNGSKTEQPVHNETVKDFLIRKYLVTQEYYNEVMGKSSNFEGTDGQKPAVVNWYAACEFCNKLSEREGLTPAYYIDKKTEDPTNKKRYASVSWLIAMNPEANGYRLPLESEWEYAARADTDLLYPGTDGEGPGEGKNGTGVDFYAWYWKNSGDKYLGGLESQWNWNIIGPNNVTTHPVGQRKPNGWGLYDMAGNAMEWCFEWYSNNYEEPNNIGYYKVLRGGDYRAYRTGLRVSARSAKQPSKGGAIRLVRKASPGDEAIYEVAQKDTSGANSVIMDEASVVGINCYVSGRTIVVENANADICVYDISGRLVACSDKVGIATIPVPKPDVYVVEMGGVSQKLVVK